jgi:hypothetical protein
MVNSPKEDRLSEEVDKLVIQYFTPHSRAAIGGHDLLKYIFPTIRIRWWEWLTIILVSILLGLLFYTLKVASTYSNAEQTLRSTLAQFAEAWPPGLTSDGQASIILDSLGVTQSESLHKDLKTAIEKVVLGSANNSSPSVPRRGPPIMSMTTQLLLIMRPGKCSTCDKDCVAAIEPMLARMLLGWPMSETERDDDVRLLQKTFETTQTGSPPPSQTEIDEACKKVNSRAEVPSWTLSRQMLWGRQAPWPAPTVAQLVLDPGKCGASATDTERDQCQLVSRLFQTALDDEDVKFARSAGVDFFYGWERALVAILFFIVGLALCRQSLGLIRLWMEAKWVRKKLDSPGLNIGLDPTKPSENISPLVASLALKEGFTGSFRPKLDGNSQEPVAEIVNAVAEAVQQEDLDYLKTFVDRNLTELEGSRELMNGIITIFPVIGFSATLLGLVYALAGSNQIATSNGEMRSAAILSITSLLSSCFATTFLALVCMAIFAVLNLLASGWKRRLITILNERLISKFRPGRRLSPEGHAVTPPLVRKRYPNV